MSRLDNKKDYKNLLQQTPSPKLYEKIMAGSRLADYRGMHKLFKTFPEDVKNIIEDILRVQK